MVTTAKEAGQAASIAHLSDEAKDAFWAVIHSIALGQIVHISGLRPLLDVAQIPSGSRGGLFSQAVRAGLLTPLMTGSGWKVSAPSDGASAHGADCRLYTRTVAP